MNGGALTQLVTAFSRDQGANVYVTHRLREHGANVWRLLQQVFALSLFAALEPPRHPLNPIVAVDPYASQYPHTSFAGARLLEALCNGRQPLRCSGCDQFERRTAMVSAPILKSGSESCCLRPQGAVIYISGSAEKMPQDVMKALEDVVQQHGGLTCTEAQAYVRQLELGRRCHVEAWS